MQAGVQEQIQAVIIGAGARGNQVFAELMRRHEIGWRVSAVVEPDELRRTAFCARYAIPPERAFFYLFIMLKIWCIVYVVLMCSLEL